MKNLSKILYGISVIPKLDFIKPSEKFIKVAERSKLKMVCYHYQFSGFYSNFILFQ